MDLGASYTSTCMKPPGMRTGICVFSHVRVNHIVACSVSVLEESKRTKKVNRK